MTLGSKLLTYCEDALFKQYGEIKLENFEKNEKANNFYLKNGWTKAGMEYDKMSGGNKYKFTKQKA